MNMYLRLWAFAFTIILSILSVVPALAATLGPAATYDELREFLSSAKNGDLILISGELSASGGTPLVIPANVRISSIEGESASIRGLRLRDASVTLSNVSLEDSLTVDGTSYIQLSSGVSVSGAAGQNGLSFSGSGALIIDRGCEITGGSESAGVSIEHRGGEFYASIEGSVVGGHGQSGGAGVVISPLSSSGAALISGSIKGGDGSAHGGHALNLYDLSGNALITIDGNLQGGNGDIGGDGIQLVAARDIVSVGISGHIKGGSGETYGGDALILMSTEDASSFRLSGTFSGGNATGPDAQPGTSLQLVGDSTASRTRVEDCILEDGLHLSPSQQPTPAPRTPDVTPLPEITFPAAAEESPLEPADATPGEAS